MGSESWSREKKKKKRHRLFFIKVHQFMGYDAMLNLVVKQLIWTLAHNEQPRSLCFKMRD